MVAPHFSTYAAFFTLLMLAEHQRGDTAALGILSFSCGIASGVEGEVRRRIS